MTLTVEDDFREFVAARWPDLEAVAYVVTLDPASARRVTTQALAGLHQRWRDALDEGRPGAEARRAVLAGALAAAPGAALNGSAATLPSPDAGPHPTSADPVTPPWEDEEDDPVVAALELAVRSSSPLERALVAAGSVWGAGPDEVADQLGMPAADVRGRAAALRTRLLAAHDAAREAEGLAPADWALDVDLDAALERLLAGQGDPPDPAALVEERRRSVRRRALVTGGAGVLVVGAAAWWLVPRGSGAPQGGAAAARATPTAVPSPDDPSWLSPSRWAPRGRLVTDSRVQGLVIARSEGVSRLLYADDVSGQRLVLAGTLNPGTDDLILRAWQGPAGADPGRLLEVPFQSPFVGADDPAVTVAVPTSPGTLVFVLARPNVAQAEYSPTVDPTVEGTVHRDWVVVDLRAGIGGTILPTDSGPALRVRCAGFDGPVISGTQTWVGQSGRDALAGFSEETNRFVADAVGDPRGSVHTEVVLDATVPGSVIDPRAISPSDGDGRVRVLRTTTRSGALIRSVRVVDDGRSEMSWLDLEPAHVLPADTPRDEPIVLQIEDVRPGVGRFLVIAPGAATVQLLSTSPNAYPVSKVTTVRHGVAIVPVVNANDAAAFRLVRRDAKGRRFGNAVPVAGRDLVDLYPQEEGTIL